jgi:hypothetical protein
MPRKSRLESEVEGVDALFGLTTVYRDYRVAHFLNQVLSLNLVSIEDLPVYSAKLKRLSAYSFYKSYSSNLRTDFFLVANSNGETRMIPDQKQIDYWLIMKGSAPQDYYNSLVGRLRAIPQVHAFRLEPDSIRDLASIIQDLEIHLVELKIAELKKQANEKQ